MHHAGARKKGRKKEGGKKREEKKKTLTLDISAKEFLLTAGIASDESSVATIMIYSQVLWALALDRIFWHVSMNVWTFVGIGSVVGSLTLVSLAREIPTLRQKEGHGDYDTIPVVEANGDAILDIDLDSIYEDSER